MRATFVSTAGDYLEAVIELDRRRFRVMDEFGGSSLSRGDVIDVELTVGLLYEDEPWESMFAGNPTGKCDLEPLTGWRYRAYGIVQSVNPILVDCGVLRVEAPVYSHDERLIGEALAFTVERLDAHAL